VAAGQRATAAQERAAAAEAAATATAARLTTLSQRTDSARQADRNANLVLQQRAEEEEQKRRAPNILIMGVPEGQDSQLRQCLRDAGIAHKPIWRLGKQARRDGRARPVMVECEHTQAKYAGISRAVLALRGRWGERAYLQDDLTSAERAQRATLRPVQQRLHAEQRNPRFHRGRLFYKDSAGSLVEYQQGVPLGAPPARPAALRTPAGPRAAAAMRAPRAPAAPPRGPQPPAPPAPVRSFAAAVSGARAPGTGGAQPARAGPAAARAPNPPPRAPAADAGPGPSGDHGPGASGRRPSGASAGGPNPTAAAAAATAAAAAATAPAAAGAPGRA